MAYKLSEGALSSIMEGGEVESPVMQILGTRKMAAGNNSNPRYRLLVSDGVYVNSFAMLATQLNNKVDEGELEDFTIIRIDRYITSSVPGGKTDKRVMILLDVNVVAPGSEVGQRIGNPQALGADGSVPAGASNPAPAPATSNNRSPVPSRTPPAFARRQGGGSLNMSVTELNSSTVTQPIACLNPYTNKWVIKVRVTKKTDIRKWSNAKGEGKLFSFDVLDESGEMRITAFKEQCDKFFDLIEVGKVFLITRGTIKPANKQYSALKNDYELTLNNDSQISPVEEDSSEIPTASFDFEPLSTVEAKEPNATLDIIGICKHAGDVVTFTTRTTNKELRKREVTLVDKSLVSVTLTLWGNEADNFDGENQPVVALKGASVKEFGGAKTVSASFTTNIFINPDIPEAHQLRGWYDNEGNMMDYKNVSLRTGGPGGDAKAVTLGDIRVMQAEQGDATAYYTFKGTVVLMKSENAIYEACPGENCNKKVIDLNNGMYRCEKCNKEYPDYSPRLLLSCGIADFTAHQWVTCFNETAEEIIGRSVADLNDLRTSDPDAYTRAFNSATFSSYNFKVRAQEQTYNDERKLRITVQSANPIDHVAYSKKLIGEFKELYETA